VRGGCVAAVGRGERRRLIGEPAERRAGGDSLQRASRRAPEGQVRTAHSVDSGSRAPRAVLSRARAAGPPPPPPTVTGFRGFYLAGDWIDTGLPATIEGAVRSGHRAAAAILESQA